MAARRALISGNSDYFSWPEHKQEIFRITKDELAVQKIKCTVLKYLLDIQCEPESIDDVWDDISDSDLNTLNWSLLLTEGVGEDFIYVNESFAENSTILDFTTLYDYDFNNHLFQERTKKEEFTDYQAKDYYPFRWAPWIRLLIDDVFSYATLTSVATHIRDEMEEFGNDYIDRLIPNELVEGKEHNKQGHGGFLWDMKIDARGHEGQLEELKTRWHLNLEHRWLTINQSQSSLKPKAYIIDDNVKETTNLTYIFNNTDALKKVGWRSFLSDSQPLITDYSDIKELLNAEIAKAKTFLDTNYQGIMDNFDPKVVKFRHKIKVIMPEGGGLDDLDTID